MDSFQKKVTEMDMEAFLKSFSGTRLTGHYWTTRGYWGDKEENLTPQEETVFKDIQKELRKITAYLEKKSGKRIKKGKLMCETPNRNLSYLHKSGNKNHFKKR